MSGSLGFAADAAGAAAATEELLADCLRLLGPDHPHTLTARGNLAYWRGDAGDAAGAAAAYLELLADRLRVLGPDHRETLAWDARRIDLAIDARHRPGEGTVLQELRELARRVSEGWEQQRLANEAGHTTRPNCLRFFKRQESQGEQIFRLGLEPIAAKVRQRRDVRALLSDSPPAATWRSSGARRGMQRVRPPPIEELLAHHLRVLGPDHTHTLTARGNLAAAAHRRGADPAAVVIPQRLQATDLIRHLGGQFFGGQRRVGRQQRRRDLQGQRQPTAALRQPPRGKAATAAHAAR